MMPRQGTVVADRYRLERKVGGGRVSAMWRVQDQVTDGTCAIKLLHRSMNDHPEALARFSLEDRLSRELTGDYFPERVGSGSWHSLRYIAWRWYEGECLRSLFERNPKQDVQTVYSIVQEACQALALVHAAGYSHGDLKPENMFFADRPGDASRQLKLLGFGVASRLARPLLGSQARRTPGQIVGTPLYLSPDLILGRVPRAGQADLWALAVIVYEALTGRAPFLGTDLSEVLEAILERRAARPSTITNLPATFDVWWAQALEQQFLSPSEFSTSLARALAPALRSSRTQRSASLPDRISPTGPGLPWRPEAATPRAPAATAAGASAPALASGLPAAAPSPPRRTQRGSVTAHGGTAAPNGSALPSASSAAAGSAVVSSAAVAGGAATATAVSRVAAGSAAAKPVANPALTDPAVSSPAVPGPASAPPPAHAEAGVAAAPAESSAHGATPLHGAPAAMAAAAPDVIAAGLAAAAAPTAARLSSSPDAAHGASASSHAASAATSGPDAAESALPAAAPAARELSPLAAATAAGLGRSPLAGSSTASAPAPRAAVTAAGVGHAADSPAQLVAARAKAESAAPGAPRREPPRPEPSASRPQPSAPVAASGARPAQRSAEASAAAEPHRPNVTSTTVAGIGPAALSLMRSRESAAAAATANVAPATHGNQATPEVAGSNSPAAVQAHEHLAALRDLAVGTRKTLVGIFPPAVPPPPAPPAAPVAVAPAAPAAAPAAAPSQSLAIAGTPCRSIDVSADDEAIDSVVPLRRVGNATVPFPRPRAAARNARLDDVPQDELLADAAHSHDGPQSWRYRTQSSLRVVLTDPDHRPHLVAGLLVCSAAALVIFALGRSPVSGTGMLGQTTGSLSGREGTSAIPAEPAVGSRRTAAAGTTLDPAAREAPEDTAASPRGSASATGEPGIDEPGRAEAAAIAPPSGPTLQGKELAPGLVVPARPAPAPAANVAKPPAVAPAAAAPAAAPPRAPARVPGPPAGGGAAAAPVPALRGPAPASASPFTSPPAPRPAAPAPGASPSGAPAPRAVPPRKPGAEPAPPRPTNPDFDFGI